MTFIHTYKAYLRSDTALKEDWRKKLSKREVEKYKGVDTETITEVINVVGNVGEMENGLRRVLEITLQGQPAKLQFDTVARILEGILDDVSVVEDIVLVDLWQESASREPAPKEK